VAMPGQPVGAEGTEAAGDDDDDRGEGDDPEPRPVPAPGGLYVPHVPLSSGRVGRLRGSGRPGQSPVPTRARVWPPAGGRWPLPRPDGGTRGRPAPPGTAAASGATWANP